MMADIAKFDPAQMMNGIKDRIKATFVDMIPEEAWEEMIKAEITSFITPRTVSSYGNQTTAPSQFSFIVQEELSKVLREMVRAELAKPEWQGTYKGDGSLNVSQGIKDMLVEKAPQVLANMLGSVFQQSIQQAHYNLPR